MSTKNFLLNDLQLMIGEYQSVTNPGLQLAQYLQRKRFFTNQYQEIPMVAMLYAGLR
jgi:hypothetical protein